MNLLMRNCLLGVRGKMKKGGKVMKNGETPRGCPSSWRPQQEVVTLIRIRVIVNQ